MTYFLPVLTQVLVFALIMTVGYVLGRFNIVPDNADRVLSRILSLVLLPAYCFSTMAENLTVEAFAANWTIILYGFGAVIFSNLVGLLLARLFTKEAYPRKVYVYSFTIANLGFFGQPLVNAVFGAEAAAMMILFTIAFNLYIFTIGYTSLTNSDKFSLKRLINPVFIMMLLGILVGLTGLKLPQPIMKAADSLSACMGPMAMLVAGIVISKYNFGKLLLNGRVVIAALIRLVALPALIVLLLSLTGASRTVIIAALGTCAMPLGLNTVVFPASVGEDTSLGASMTLISTLLGMITIPLMFMLFLK